MPAGLKLSKIACARRGGGDIMLAPICARNRMQQRQACSMLILGMAVYLGGCAAASLTGRHEIPKKRSIKSQRTAVVPFLDPSYRGKEFEGVGESFAVLISDKLLAAGIPAEVVRGPKEPESATPDIETQLKMASDKGYSYVLMGSITEWVDGATQWSGREDVAAISVRIYDSRTREVVMAVSARENGTWLTFVDSPVTRFCETLSAKLVSLIAED